MTSAFLETTPYPCKERGLLIWLNWEPPKASFMSRFNSHMTGTERLTEYAGELPLFPSDPCNKERGRENEEKKEKENKIGKDRNEMKKNIYI